MGGTGDHVLDEISVAGGIDDGEVIFGGLELPKGDINGDTSFSLALKLVHNPSILEGALAELGGFLLELLDGTLVDSTALVDEVTGGGGLAGLRTGGCTSELFPRFLGHSCIEVDDNVRRRVQ